MPPLNPKPLQPKTPADLNSKLQLCRGLRGPHGIVAFDGDLNLFHFGGCELSGFGLRNADTTVCSLQPRLGYPVEQGFENSC